MTVKQLTAPTTIRIEPEIKTWLLQESHRQNRTVSNLINTILIEYKDRGNVISGYLHVPKEWLKDISELEREALQKEVMELHKKEVK